MSFLLPNVISVFDFSSVYFAFKTKKCLDLVFKNSYVLMDLQPKPISKQIEQNKAADLSRFELQGAGHFYFWIDQNSWSQLVCATGGWLFLFFNRILLIGSWNKLGKFPMSMFFFYILWLCTIVHQNCTLR